MTKRDFTFYAGEATITMGAAFTSEKWDHVQRCGQFEIVEDREFFDSRRGVARKGLIFLADLDDKILAEENLLTLSAAGIPCWPDPRLLLQHHDRHRSLDWIHSQGYVNHPIWIGRYEDCPINSSEYWGKYLWAALDFKYPLVLKVGNCHRGAGKFLVTSEKEWAEVEPWTGDATIEPFWEGRSVRVLLVGDYVTTFEITNPDSWIKNSAGCDVQDYDASPKLLEHAKSLAEWLGFEVAGVDYVVTPDGEYHFLEINAFPGLTTVPDADRDIVKSFFVAKMKQVEEMCKLP